MFETIEKLPADPILGLTAAFNEDSNPKKIDLSVGVYKDESGKTPIFAAVKRAEKLWLGEENTKVYIPPPGYPEFNTAMQPHILGAGHQALKENRVRSVMAPGGCGAVRVGAELLNRSRSGATIWVSKPTWNNHGPLLGSAGLKIKEYPYYSDKTHGVEADAMLSVLRKVGKSDIVLMHACCHNPTGADLSREDWQAVARLAQKQGFLPFVDCAYHGMAEGLEEDGYGARLLAESVPEMLIAYSCSKNFGLYRDRIGALLVVAADAGRADAGLTHVNNIARAMYSMPPAHGGAIVKTILGDRELYRVWKEELDGMRVRMNSLRALFADTLAKKKAPRDFSFVKSQRGLFSMLGLKKEQVQRLRKEFSVYIVESSRMNIAGISQKNIEYLTDSILAVL
ncbi:MAG: aspartate/tyrosine/aromatic aminotransferase [Gammaproteobacteria bacterium]|nr:aspartate/tyrosine/aromatic aminotransferase [Gammaproteobacteria bacterium]